MTVRQDTRNRRSAFLSAVALPTVLGIALSLTLPPLTTGALSPVVLAALLVHAARAPTPRGVAGRIWWSVFAMTAVHLWWLTDFLGNIFHAPPAGVLAVALYALEAGFFAAMAWLVASMIRTPTARLWALAGGWGAVEFARFLGPLAFPWPTLGYALLPTPLIQVADLGGVLLASVLILALAAALGEAWTRRRWQPLAVMALVWATALGYGLTRMPGQGPEQAIRVTRQTFGAFERASGALSPEQQREAQVRASAARRPDEVLVWSETALDARSGVPHRVPVFPGPGISGLGVSRLPQAPNLNGAVAVDAEGQVTGFNVKAKLVPFGEYFPLYAQVPALYAPIEQRIGFPLRVVAPARAVVPLTLGGVQYGTYICYDSVFPWVARQLVLQGAQVLVNPSNDGWYTGWGTRQHFWMGRVRAIEQRRWLVRSVNEGVAGSVNDLGQPVELLTAGEGIQTRRVVVRVLNRRSLYSVVGDWPALGLFAALLVWGLGMDLRSRSGASTGARLTARERSADGAPCQGLKGRAAKPLGADPSSIVLELELMLMVRKRRFKF